MCPALTEAVLLAKSKCSSLSEVHNVNLWGQHLDDLSLLAEITDLETASLSVNDIVSLEWASHCLKLKELYLRRNKIAELDQLKYLVGLPDLRVLWLSDNPVTAAPDYRLYTIALLTGLTKLDEVDITPADRADAAKKFPNLRAKSEPAAVPAQAARLAPAAPVRGARGHVLEAIRLLMLDLDPDELDILGAEIGRLKAKA
jgi:hypothetical protein